MNPLDQDTEAQLPSRLDLLKQRADILGVTYHPSIGVEKLQEKVNAALAKNGSDSPAAGANTEAEDTGESEVAYRRRMLEEASKLVRIRVACMNPLKKEWDGEIFTCGNSIVGTFKKFVPFNSEEGWHVPHIIFQMIRDRECQIFLTKKDGRGNAIKVGKLIKEFSVEVLPPLTEEELKELARRQAMAGSVD
jgi:hypothetical protein